MGSMLKFRRGTLEQLNQIETDGSIKNFAEGSINFTTDEPAIYIDVIENGENKRKRIGDLIEVENYQALLDLGDQAPNNFDNAYYDNGTIASKKSLPSWSTTALYYVKSDNALLKYLPATADSPNGTWVRINADAEKIATKFISIDEDRKTFFSDYMTNVLDKDYDNPEHKGYIPTLNVFYNKILGDWTGDGLQEVNVNDRNLASIYAMLLGYTPSPFEEGSSLTDSNFTQNSIKETQSALIHVQNTLEKKIENATDNLITGGDGSETELPEYNGETTKNLLTFYKYLIDGSSTLNVNDTVTNFPQMITKMEQTIAAADAMTFVGILNKDHSIASYYSDERRFHAGDTFKVAELGRLYSSNNDGILDTYETIEESQIGDYKDTVVFAGDLIIVKEDWSAESSTINCWHVASGLEENNESILSGTTDERKVSLGTTFGLKFGSIILQPAEEDNNIKIKLTTEEEGFGYENKYSMHLEWESFE